MSETSKTSINETKILLPVIRKIYPTLIAHSIIGVQPMVGPGNSIFQLRFRYDTYSEACFTMKDKLFFRNFLRLNDKRKSFTEKDLIKANYPVIKLQRDKVDQKAEIWEWCDKNIGPYHWIHNGFDVVAFSDENHAVLFKMVWHD